MIEFWYLNNDLNSIYIVMPQCIWKQCLSKPAKKRPKAAPLKNLQNSVKSVSERSQCWANKCWRDLSFCPETEVVLAFANPCGNSPLSGQLQRLHSFNISNHPQASSNPKCFVPRLNIANQNSCSCINNTSKQTGDFRTLKEMLDVIGIPLCFLQNWGMSQSLISRNSTLWGTIFNFPQSATCLHKTLIYTVWFLSL